MMNNYYGSHMINDLRRKLEDDSLTLSRLKVLELLDYIEALETTINFAADMGGVEEVESDSIVASYVREEFDKDKLPDVEEEQQ